jgi:hypothetical protein
MPAKSKNQYRLMQAVANNPDFAKKVGISKEVGEEFVKETPSRLYKKLKKKLSKK